MKLPTFIAIILLGIGCWYVYESPLGASLAVSLRGWLKEKPDPKRDLDRMAEKLPRHLRPGEDVTEVSTYIEQRDDPIVPILGYLTFVGASRYEFVFNWETDHWVFSQMISREMNHDMTQDPAGLEIMNGPEMTRFLYPYKYPGARPAATTRNPAAVAPTTAASGASPRTPTPQEKATEIARKYGSPR